jgi:nucleoside-diphosphate-sugar epimerase
MNADEFHDKQVLITGGLGFIGSNLARRLVQLGAEVRLVDSLIPEYGGNWFNIADIRDRAQVNLSDVRDTHSLPPLVQNVDYLFNLAGQVSHQAAFQDPLTDVDINCKAQLAILEACRHFNPSVKIVFTSTRHIYGKPEYLPVDENHPLQPLDINGVNKMAGERYHVLYHQIYGLRTCALRLTSTYGRGMRVKDARQTFLGIWVRRLLEGQPFEVWGGEQLRDYTHVEDVVDALLIAATHPAANGQVFNLGGDCVISLKDTAQVLVEAYGKGEFTIRNFPEERQKSNIGDCYNDYSLARSKLGWKPKIALKQGFSKTIAFYQEHLAHYL